MITHQKIRRPSDDEDYDGNDDIDNIDDLDFDIFTHFNNSSERLNG